MAPAVMIRVQVQLTQIQQNALRQLSTDTGKSIAALIREGVEQILTAKPLPSRQDRIERAIRVAGQFASGGADGSAEHDRHLAATFRR